MSRFITALTSRKNKVDEVSTPSADVEKKIGSDDGSLDEKLPQLSYSGSGASSETGGSDWHMQRQSAYEIMAETLFREAQREHLFSYGEQRWNGVALRLAKGKYVCSPQHDPRLAPWVSALTLLNCESMLTLTANVVAGITSNMSPDAQEIALSPEVRIQVVENVTDLGTVRKAQGAAFVRREHMLCVWSDHVSELIKTAKGLEDKMIRFIWQRAVGSDLPASAIMAQSSSNGSVYTAGASRPVSGHFDTTPAIRQATEGTRRGAGGEKIVTSKKFDQDEKCPEGEDPEAMVTYQERTTNLQAPLQHGLAVALNTLLTFGLLTRRLVYEALLDHMWMRFAIAVAIPPCFVVTLFFSDSIVNGLAQIFAPIRQMSLNSRYYSGKAPERMMGRLPHVTIQMPVYKESLESVLIPTIESVKKAIQTYELQGGTASILIAEDGLLLVDETERQKRLEYYEMNQIGWIARPGHGVDGYIRAGRFKKASNLNFTCAVSLALEKIMATERPTGRDLEEWTLADENDLYERALAQALAEAHPLACGAGNVRIGESFFSSTVTLESLKTASSMLLLK